MPGTCSTFIVDDRWAVKFSGELFEGGASFRSEQDANRGMIERAKHLTLLHRFNVLAVAVAVAVARQPGAAAPADLGELMAAVWGEA